MLYIVENDNYVLSFFPMYGVFICRKKERTDESETKIFTGNNTGQITRFNEVAQDDTSGTRKEN